MYVTNSLYRKCTFIQIFERTKHFLFSFRPLMILVQKVTSIAFAVHDGTQKKDEDLNSDQKIMKIE